MRSKPPITDWMREAYESSDRLSGRAGKSARPEKRAKKRKRKTSRHVKDPRPTVKCARRPLGHLSCIAVVAPRRRRSLQ